MTYCHKNAKRARFSLTRTS